MVKIELMLFGVFLLMVIILDIIMLISLIKLGDERKKLIIWKASTYTLLGTVGTFVIYIIKNVVFLRRSMVIDLKNNIRDKRKKQGLSQKELAKKCGVSRQTINAIENNKYDPTLILAFSLARELNTRVDELFFPF